MTKERIIVLGLMSHFPVAGVAWQTVHYLIGFERLGYEVFYVECHDCPPTKLMTSAADDGPIRAASYIEAIMRRFDFTNRWAYHSVSDSRYFGLSSLQLADLYRSAAVIMNLHGSHLPTPELTATNRLVYLETDPVEVEIDLFHKDQETFDYLQPHCAFFTFGENIGRPGCLVPPPGPFKFLPTRQPVVIDFWKDKSAADGFAFTTIGNWRQPLREVHFQGELYRWSKHFEFEKFIDLPRRTNAPLELALSSSSCNDDERRLLQSKGWRVCDALDFSSDLDRYRDYIASSRAEFTVAKDQNVRLRSGWFSDRSVTYLAAGRPVVTQDTAFGEAIPAGEGLFAFSTMEDIVASIEAINRNYQRHCRAAESIAREYFSHEVVLTRLLQELGIHRARKGPAPTESVLPASMVLAPTSRWPTRLAPDTVKTALSLPIPVAKPGLALSSKRASIAIVTYNGLPYTKMCLTSLLASDWDPSDELIIVDNDSGDGTQDFLRDLQRVNPFIRVEVNKTNRGFAAANNQALALAAGDILILLNNDTIVTSGWRNGLAHWLERSEIGMVGPVTNRTCNEAQIDAPYRTYAELEEFAAEYTRSHVGRSTETRMLAMFCMAIRRDTLARVGTLDERFELGMFEDDDYAERVRQAGYKIICTEDVFVHHFGQAALGELCANDEYDRVFESNRRRFEAKWSIEWQPHGRRITSEYEHLRKSIQRVVTQRLPEGATVLVISKGDEELLNLSGYRGWHFPRDDEGRYPYIYPADSAAAITQLELARTKGAGFLVIPKPAFWWLEYYSGFKEHLEGEYALSLHDEERCLIFDLAGTRATQTRRS